jgi:AraC-like DNA-binding protein
MPITQVALNSGYQSSTGFSVAFRKETGMSPREYRKQWRGG